MGFVLNGVCDQGDSGRNRVLSHADALGSAYERFGALSRLAVPMLSVFNAQEDGDGWLLVQPTQLLAHLDVRKFDCAEGK